jgi:hypothetical protein
MAVDRGFFAFIDLKFGEWPTLLLTFPKASPNNGGDVVLCLAVVRIQSRIVGSVCFWAFWIRILLSSSKNSKKIFFLLPS